MKKSKRRYADGGNVMAASSTPTSAFTQPVSQVQPSPSNIFSTPNYNKGSATGQDGNTPLVVVNAGSNGAQPSFRKGGKVSKSSKGASRGDGCAQRGKTRGRFV